MTDIYTRTVRRRDFLEIIGTFASSAQRRRKRMTHKERSYGKS